MRLPKDYYMLWRVDEKNTVDKALAFFKKKYSKKPTKIAIGKGIEFKSDKLELVEMMCPDKHIKVG